MAQFMTKPAVNLGSPEDLHANKAAKHSCTLLRKLKPNDSAAPAATRPNFSIHPSLLKLPESLKSHTHRAAQNSCSTQATAHKHISTHLQRLCCKHQKKAAAWARTRSVNTH
eukprot:scaffold71679_cov20-Tisochrysis_lutea.AAC.1